MNQIKLQHRNKKCGPPHYIFWASFDYRLQLLHHTFFSMRRSVAQRGTAILVRLVDLCFCVEELLHYTFFSTPRSASTTERCLAILVPLVHLCFRVEELLHHTFVSMRRSVAQRGTAI